MTATLAEWLLAEDETVSPRDPSPSWGTHGIEDTCEHEHADSPRVLQG